MPGHDLRRLAHGPFNLQFRLPPDLKLVVFDMVVSQGAPTWTSPI
jgi:hypothetical protein